MRCAWQAIALTKERLAVKETPRLWWTLGSLTADDAAYEKAWSLSNGRFSMAQRSIGRTAMKRGEVCRACVVRVSCVRYLKLCLCLYVQPIVGCCSVGILR